ncbi:hypothetical protein PCANC_19633 [Puccinia coronata f. sp. avenae]|uniref:Uncharacterized protein n=1 Tax=Puccinia coronata f. sp. avenae TaxID=200324 RepID=A0A2N5U0S5_9BASI|nr:hypothetical protein PCANC_19633 [Puccinia coronata f. sp. avenae]
MKITGTKELQQSLVVALFRYLDHSQSRLLNSSAIQGCSPIKYHTAPSSSITPLTPLHHQPSLRSTIIHPQDSLVKSQLVPVLLIHLFSSSSSVVRLVLYLPPRFWSCLLKSKFI